MGSKQLSLLLRDLAVEELRGEAYPLVSGLAYHSADVGPGFLFFALEGIRSDGHLFIDEAVHRGAVAVVHTQRLPRYTEGAVFVRVRDSRAFLSIIAARFYGDPSRELTVVGVTGTDGKSTTVWFTCQLLEKLGQSCGLISTPLIKTGSQVEKNPFRQSTPEAPEVHRILRRIRNSGSDIAVIEATSHGLSAKTKRLADVCFDAAVFTNVTHEHLEFHGTLDQYRSDKANLFRALGAEARTSQGAPHGPTPFGVVNRDDIHHRMFVEAANAPVYTYSLESEAADIYAKDIESGKLGSSFTLVMDGYGRRGELTLPGLYNIGNLMAATLVVNRLLGVPLSQISPFFPELTALEGRMTALDLGQPFDVIVDFAHTPGASLQYSDPPVKETPPNARPRGKLLLATPT